MPPNSILLLGFRGRAEPFMIHDYRGYSDQQLFEYIYNRVPHSDEHMSAQYELSRRREQKEFWYRTVVAWSALGVAVVSLIFSAISLFHRCP